MPRHHDLPSAWKEDHGCLGTLNARADSPRRQITHVGMEIIALIRQRTHLAALAAAAHRLDLASARHSRVPTKQSGDSA